MTLLSYKYMEQIHGKNTIQMFFFFNVPRNLNNCIQKLSYTIYKIYFRYIIFHVLSLLATAAFPTGLRYLFTFSGKLPSPSLFYSGCSPFTNKIIDEMSFLTKNLFPMRSTACVPSSNNDKNQSTQ